MRKQVKIFADTDMERLETKVNDWFLANSYSLIEVERISLSVGGVVWRWACVLIMVVYNE